ncbi:hypothetical protein [Kocuria kalidii]|uniref:hypothetical protein n=1 Tax=Kocuria kalidii TaxID=3376283 RepID=UPI0037B7850C
MGRTLLALRDRSEELSRSCVAGLMECVLEQFLVQEAATDSPRYRETWRRLRFVVDQARAWGTATHGSLRDYLRLVEASRIAGSRWVTRVAHAAPSPPGSHDGLAVASTSPAEIPADHDAAPAAPGLPALAEPERFAPLEIPPAESRGAVLHGPAFGTALHRLLELCDLADRESLDRHAPSS